jgi:hypothetical protein
MFLELVQSDLLDDPGELGDGMIVTVRSERRDRTRLVY